MTKTFTTYQQIREFVYAEAGIGLKSDIFFYRGTKTNHILPSIVPANNRLTSHQLRIIEERIHSEYVNFIGKNAETKVDDWKLRVRAREHGLFNRLMDWSQTLHIALDFTTSLFSGQAALYSNSSRMRSGSTNGN